MTREGSARARTATLVIVGPPDRLTEAAEVLASIDQAGSLRHVLLSTTEFETPSAAGIEEVTTLDRVRPEYVDNAIAALRLSSLPTVIWWRGGPSEQLEGAATLADRLILDVPEPVEVWSRVRTLFGRTSVTDVRWARLTRWRAVTASMFELPEVRAGSVSIERLVVSGGDRAVCALFGGWLDASLGWNGRVAVDVEIEPGRPPLTAVRLAGPSLDVALALASNGVCLAASARHAGTTLASRVVSLGEGRLPALISEELRIRSRDIAFERAVERALERAGGRGV